MHFLFSKMFQIFVNNLKINSWIQVFSQILIKDEAGSDNNDSESDYFPEDSNFADDYDAGNSPACVDNNNSNDSFLWDKKPPILTEEEADPPKIKEKKVSKLKKEKKELKTKKATDKKPKKTESKKKAKDAKKRETDPNMPKKKRPYKKRATKEKRTFECEICHYKCEHECKIHTKGNAIFCCKCVWMHSTIHNTLFAGHLRRHKLIHLNEKSFICDQCGKGFNLFINLNAHIRRHIGFKPHICDICKASFLDKTRLKMHMRTHTGERPFGNLCTE